MHTDCSHRKIRVFAIYAAGALSLGYVTLAGSDIRPPLAPLTGPAGSKEIRRVNIPRTTLLKTIFEAGRGSGECLGVVLTRRSAASTEVGPINAENVTVNDLLNRALEGMNGFVRREVEGCIIVAPTNGGPSYLQAKIPSFQAPRAPLPLQSYRLFQAVLAIELKSVPKGGLGTVSSVSWSTDSPLVGPVDATQKSTEQLLCMLARGANSTMWVAVPRTTEPYESWRFVRYSEPDLNADQELRSIVESIPADRQ